MTETQVAAAVAPDQEPVDLTFPDAELEQYATARKLAKLLKVQTLYYNLFREFYGGYALVAQSVAQELAPEKPQVAADLRASVLRIGGYQIWSEVRRSIEVYDRFYPLWGWITGVGIVVAGTLHYPAVHSFWTTVWYTGVVAVTALATAFIAALFTEIQVPKAHARRRTIAMIGLIAFFAAGWLIGRWHSFWGTALFAGIAVAVISLVLVGLIAEIANVAVSTMFHRSWSRLTADEIAETLASLAWVLRHENEPEFRTWAVSQLEHVANCVERYLPSYLTRSWTGPGVASLLGGTHSTFNEMAAEIRRLSRDYLVPKATSLQSVRDELDRLMIASAQGLWGEWGRISADDTPYARWRPWVSGTLRTILLSLPTVIALAGTFYLYKTNPSSPLLKAEVIAPVLVTTLTPLTKVLTPGRRAETASAAAEHRTTSRTGVRIPKFRAH